MLSAELMTPSEFPPCAGLSNSASAMNPFGSSDSGCTVKLPNNSPPSLMSPSPSRSSASHESSDPAAVHDSLSAEPSPLMSKGTPSCAPVMRKPSPATSTSTGEGVRQAQVFVSQG